ncbi:MAG: saccharopine dehydrogenase NADP-binding domain-containing protein [Anaerolineales bacterium]|nr:saccharopine dehydrogenase NADP-binding domain-containing protein [Anaerolineales bacterium]
MDQPRTILVIGASGGLGQHICREVIRQFGPGALLVGDYKPERGRETANRLGADVSFAQVDADDLHSLHDALQGGVNAVIVSVQQREPLAQSACIEAGIPCLDVTVQPNLIAQIHQLDVQAQAAQTSLVVMAGLFPGLSGVMARRAAEMLDQVDSLDVALCQSSQSSTGATGIADMLGLFAQPAKFRANGREETVPGFTRKRRFLYPPPLGEKTHRLVNFIEAQVISQELGIPNVNFWTGYDQPSFDLLLAVLNKLKILALFNRPGPRMKLARVVDAATRANTPETEACSVVAEAAGLKDRRPQLARVSILAPSDYGTTAMSVVAMAKLLLTGEVATPGVHHPARIFTLEQLLRHTDQVELFQTLDS